LTWHRRLGHLSFKTIVELAQGGASGVEIIDVPVRIPGLDACSTCVAAKMVHLPHKEGRGHATKYLKRVHVDIAGPMHVPSAGGRLYLYVAVDDCTRAVYTRPLFLKSEAPEAFRVFRAAAENESGRQLRDRQRARTLDGRNAQYLRTRRYQVAHDGTVSPCVERSGRTRHRGPDCDCACHAT